MRGNFEIKFIEQSNEKLLVISEHNCIDQSTYIRFDSGIPVIIWILLITANGQI